MNALWIKMSSLWSAFPLEWTGKRLRTFGRGESGAAAIFFALSSPVWIGGLALGAEVGSWLFFQQRLQATADAVAASIASRVGTGAPQAELDTLATDFLRQNQFQFCDGCWEVTLAAPSGPVFVNGNTVNVQLRRPVNRLLTRFFQPGSFNIQVNSSAQVSMATQGCILGLGTQNTLDIGPANINVTGCEVLSNGDSRVGGGSSLATDCARSRGFITVWGTLTVNCRNGQPEREAGMTLDPYVDIPDLDLSGIECDKTTSGPVTISTNQDWNGKFTSVPRSGRNYIRICAGSSLTIKGTVAVRMPNTTTFIFDGIGVDFRIENTNVTGVAQSYFFMNGARPVINAPNSSVNLQAAGGAAGMLFRGARGNTLGAGLGNQITVGPNSNLTGAIYFPASPVQFQANGNVSACLQIIGRAVVLRGAWQMTGPCAIALPLRPIVASRDVDLTQ
jgi:Flp pilus assembly protein TadG